MKFILALFLSYWDWYKISFLCLFWFKKSFSNWFECDIYDKTMEWEVSESLNTKLSIK